MIIQRMFSRSKKKDKDEEKTEKKKRINKDLAVGAGLVGGGLGVNTLGGVRAEKSLLNNNKYPEEGKELTKKVLAEAKAKGVPIHVWEKGDLYTPTGKRLQDEIGKSLEDFVHSNPAAYLMNEDKIGIQKDVTAAPVLAHELGHRHYVKEKAGKIGKISHKLYKLHGGSLSFYGAPGVGIVSGTAAGKSKARREEKGEKESKLGKVVQTAAPLALMAPGLVAEYAASKRGIRSLRSKGASKEYLKEAKKGLRDAYSTYAGLAAIGVGSGELSKGVAYKKEKRKIEKEKKLKEYREAKNENN